jgi:ribose transport system substrate-binding protein
MTGVEQHPKGGTAMNGRKNGRRAILVLVTLSILVAVVSVSANAKTSAEATPAKTAKPAKQYTIVFSDFSTTDTFGIALARGVKQAAAKLGDKVVSVTDGQFNPTKQGRDMQDLVALGPDAILLAASDSAQSRAWVAGAAAAKIPVFTVYLPVDHYGTPLYKGVTGGSQLREVEAGAAAGKIAAQYVKPGSTVGVVLGQAGFAEVPARLSGFKRAISKRGKYTVIASQPGPWTPVNGQAQCQSLISAHPDMKLIYNESDAMTAGCVKATNLGKVLVVGNGGSSQGIALIKAGKALGTTCYGPVEFGSSTMKLAHSYLTGAAKAGRLIVRSPIPITKKNLAACPKEW